MGAIIIRGGDIKAAREKRGLTQKQLAKLLGVTHSAISHWELGRTEVAPASAKNLARWLSAGTASDVGLGVSEEKSSQSLQISRDIHAWRAATQPFEIHVSQKLKESATELELDLKALFETVGTEAVRDALAQEWRRRNADAIRHNNEELERNGLWSDGYRLF
jgi:antitoxin CcdA